MKTKYTFRLIAPAMLLGVAMAMPAFAQYADPNAPASAQMNEAGQDMKQAGSDTAAAASDTYHAGKRAVKDTAITAKVKTALHEDKDVGKADIHVSTTGGIVTLQGQVPSPMAAAHAAQVAERLDGVKKVDNQLMVISSSSTD